ncbi:hypothetical protein CCAN12_540011 [Capnocytophaga canimorsus]|uniref:Uncharacterized protein n=1 Tax=Capnocytophaga canimorsus TaxID=28188 RepID=A0A0B7H4I9_9FLAO|nr:hypothetical protein CCAN12_540011 [Capnocytophaga canimorsus]
MKSAYIVEVVKKLSSIYALPETEIARITTENSKSVFRI